MTLQQKIIYRNIRVRMLQMELSPQEFAFKKGCSANYVYVRINRLRDDDVDWFAEGLEIPTEVLMSDDLERVVTQ
jgi:hypothetical protein